MNFIFAKVKYMMKVLYGLDFGSTRLPIRPLDQAAKNKILKDREYLINLINERAKL